ncbi:hypothetical protein T4B_8196 [Trichinella pseudospiralis]|nr:hypothetical protein T4E_7188 [Trichinella pseudospiralis]KRY77362.1 hypothetical protein T4A_12702 [Trichinella pseudospiralis]KRZ31969.1 hypothetical protein T4B_8196 [Trichinella pseudospiralis]KRZ44753.1 hypothetical protein T4C_7152 [Trichinella pseudospiralis]
MLHILIGKSVQCVCDLNDITQRSSGYAIEDGKMKTGCGLATPSKKTPPE